MSAGQAVRPLAGAGAPANEIGCYVTTNVTVVVCVRLPLTPLMISV
jgi:hypothetical protein